MMLDQSFQSKLPNDVLSHRFSDADDLVNYVQTRTGKFDRNIVTSYWLGRDHMINDELVLLEYIKFECSR